MNQQADRSLGFLANSRMRSKRTGSDPMVVAAPDAVSGMPATGECHVIILVRLQRIRKPSGTLMAI